MEFSLKLFLAYLVVNMALVFFARPGYCKLVSLKIVEEPSNLGANSYMNQQQSQAETLKMRIQPSNFSGPEHLKRLAGKCFTKIDTAYKYEVCPFSNITQHEQSLRWNPYSGVLGVWQEWDIENNTFVAMEMPEGDECGSRFRSVKLFLECGEDNIVDRVTEPQTCEYHIFMKTPLVCHPHSMLVYPTLPPPLKLRWDYLEGALHNEDLTEKGYKKKLGKIFEEAGYQIPHAAKQKISSEARTQGAEESQDEAGNFLSLAQCNVEYNKLKAEVASLRVQLELNLGASATNRTASEDHPSSHKTSTTKKKKVPTATLR